MNVYDSIKMKELLDPFGFESTDDMVHADMVIINTCHIREKASEKLYSELGRVKKIKDKRQMQNVDKHSSKLNILQNISSLQAPGRTCMYLG